VRRLAKGGTEEAHDRRKRLMVPAGARAGQETMALKEYKPGTTFPGRMGRTIGGSMSPAS
jgi:hypothetical protein